MKVKKKEVGMYWTLFLPDIRPAGYPVRAGHRISGRILDLTTIFLVKYLVNLIKTALTIT
jgi:hypothetical protein